MIYAWSYTKEAIFFTSFNVARAINLCGWGTCQDLGGFWTYNAVLQFSCSITGLTRVYAYSEVEKNNWANRWLWHLNRSISISISIYIICICFPLQKSKIVAILCCNGLSHNNARFQIVLPANPVAVRARKGIWSVADFWWFSEVKIWKNCRAR
jgi:hypothetical protein